MLDISCDESFILCVVNVKKKKGKLKKVVGFVTLCVVNILQPYICWNDL